MLGMTSVTTYQITCSNHPEPVARELKYFVWLRERLVAKYPGIAVPPLPSKSLEQSFEDSDAVVGGRGVALETFLNRLAWHPVLRAAPVLQLFLQATDKNVWKEGIKTHDKDKEIGKRFFSSVKCEGALPDNADSLLFTFKQYLVALDKSMRLMQLMKEGMIRRSNVDLKKDYEKFANSTRGLSTMVDIGCCWRPSCPACTPLDSAIVAAGNTLTAISEMWAFNGNVNFMGLNQVLEEFAGIVKSYLEVLKIRDAALAQYLSAYGKLTKTAAPTEEETRRVNLMKRTCDTITAILLAEADEFHSQRIVDFKATILAFVKNQLQLHQKMAAAWESILPLFEVAPTPEKR
eukprot:TRINITY_DN3174_c0_g1_i2.p1 TRINITY_DN3174_c0_g1~~TRINITY_DN3174_c0_g1_i2.p1  ORF type:complete len:348 (-),score=98.12 TRINITY_DN3174_c0_g1_i2:2-1045(-)